MGKHSREYQQKNPRRDDLLKIYQAALARVAGEQAVAHWLTSHDPGPEPRAVVAIGKAAAAMMLGAKTVLGDRLAAGLVLTRHGHADPQLDRQASIVQFESAHPVPDASSLEAGNLLLAFIARQPARRPLLFLFSGGGSSLVEVLPGGCRLAHLQELNQWLLSGGLDIRTVNGVRSRFSCIKGGQLRSFLDGREAMVLFLSDVPGDNPAYVASGLLHALPPATLPEGLPPELRNRLHAQPATRSREIPHHLVAGNADAVLAAARAARELGHEVTADYPFFEREAAETGRAFARLLKQARPGVHILGGESTVSLPPSPGRGGRNQHLALAAAGEIQGREDILILAAGTDGSDGMSEDAGALVDGGTWARAYDEGLDPLLSLANADSGSLLQATGDLIHTGPTGTNVMDLLIGMRVPVSGEHSREM
jgi:hydroxypyruvate reductase